MKSPWTVLKRIGATTHELDADELQDDAAQMSCCPLSDLHRGRAGAGHRPAAGR